MFDTHCHLTFDCYEGRVDEVLAAAVADGVRGCISISTTTGDLDRLVGLAETHDRVWCSSGVHPLYSDRPIDWEVMGRAARHPKCVAWGELGLDRHYPEPAIELQRAVLEEQLARIEAWTSEGLSKPVVVHCREAFDDLLASFVHPGLMHGFLYTLVAERERAVRAFGTSSEAWGYDLCAGLFDAGTGGFAYADPLTAQFDQCAHGVGHGLYLARRTCGEYGPVGAGAARERWSAMCVNGWRMEHILWRTRRVGFAYPR